ncbi:MAG: hypothetical protein E7279_01450 [Lachnospiraceae bacterium]|nr:hypothetical protein [Lachnospiraceae bacterium]
MKNELLEYINSEMYQKMEFFIKKYIDSLINDNKVYFEGVFSPIYYLNLVNDDGSKNVYPVTDYSVKSFFDQVTFYCDDINNMLFNILNVDIKSLSESWDNIVRLDSKPDKDISFDYLCGNIINYSAVKAIKEFIFDKLDFTKSNYTVTDVNDFNDIFKKYIIGYITLKDASLKKNYNDFYQLYFKLSSISSYNNTFNIENFKSYYDKYNYFWLLPDYERDKEVLKKYSLEEIITDLDIRDEILKKYDDDHMDIFYKNKDVVCI